MESVTNVPSIDIEIERPGRTRPMPSVTLPSIRRRSFLSIVVGGVTMMTCEVCVALYSAVAEDGR